MLLDGAELVVDERTPVCVCVNPCILHALDDLRSPPIRLSVHPEAKVVPVDVLVCIKELRFVEVTGQSVGSVVRHGGLPCFRALLGGDDDNAVTAADSIDRCCSRILQHGDALDIRRVQVHHLTGLHTVYNIKRMVIRAVRAESADYDVCVVRTRGTHGLHGCNSGEFTCQHTGHIGLWRLLKILRSNVDDRGSHILLLLHAVAHDHDFVQEQRILRQNDAKVLAGELHGLVCVAYAADFELGAHSHRDGEFSIRAGDRAVSARAHLDHGRTRHR